MDRRNYGELLARLQAHLELPPDKPDEDYESTLRALWLAAADRPMSADAAGKHELPPLTDGQHRQLETWVGERLAGRPLAYITGRQSFMGVDFVVRPGALIPRRETELLGEAALAVLRGYPEQPVVRCLDVCTGCGNLAIALAIQWPAARFLASDLCEEAVEVARENATLHGLENDLGLFVGDLFEPFAAAEHHQRYDLITCNPPYVSSTNVPQMAAEISGHEPPAAFDGGFGGMAILRRLVAEAPQYLVPGGWLVFEVGAGQGEAVIKRLRARSPFREIDGVCDAAGTVRVVTARL